jgi:hypothetical protein
LKIILIKNYKKSVDKGFPPPHIDYAKGEQIMNTFILILAIINILTTLIICLGEESIDDGFVAWLYCCNAIALLVYAIS